MGKSVGCPYNRECGIIYRNRNAFYCYTGKYLKCVEFQVLRSKESKDKCSECGGSRYLSDLLEWGDKFLHIGGCSKLRSKGNKDNCSECGGYRMGEAVMHNNGCSKCVTSTTGVSMNDYYNKNE